MINAIDTRFTIEIDAINAKKAINSIEKNTSELFCIDQINGNRAIIGIYTSANDKYSVTKFYGKILNRNGVPFYKTSLKSNQYEKII